MIIFELFYLDNDILKAEFYDSQGCPKPVQVIKEEANNAALRGDHHDSTVQLQALASKKVSVSLADPVPNLLCYPSPHAGKWTIALRSIDESRGNILIQTMNGRVLLNQEVSLMDGINTWQIDRSDWPEGVLLVSVQSEQGRFSQRVVHLK